MLTSKSEQSLIVYPSLILHAIHGKQGGAARVYCLARHVDQLLRGGSGWVADQELLDFLLDLSVHPKSAKRWITQALQTGLFIRGVGGRLAVVSMGRAAVLLGVDQIGRAVACLPGDLVCKGWRANVWAAYLAATLSRPISQKTLRELTGVPERTQRLYKQELLPGCRVGVRKSYADTGLSGAHVAGVKDTGRSSAFVGGRGSVVYRLPDLYVIPAGVAKVAPRGRGRKYQKQVNQNSFSEERVKGSAAVVRLFHETRKSALSQYRKVLHADMSPSLIPQEVFYLRRAGEVNNFYGVMPIIPTGGTP